MSEFKGTVTEFLAVRRKVAETLRAGTNQQEATRIRMAEQLMEQGFIDSGAVLHSMQPEQTETVIDPDDLSEV